MRRLCLAVFCFLLSVSAYANGPSEESLGRAKVLYDKAKIAFELRRFEEAIDYFEQAYEEVQFPEFLLNIAQCYKQLGRCEDAIFLYKQYLNQGENIDREGTQKLINACEEELAAEALAAQSQPATGPSTEPIVPLPTMPIPPFWYDVRLVLGSGSVGSQETGGKNTLGPGLALAGGARFDLSSSLDALVLASLEAHSTGVVANADSVLESALDLRTSLTGYGAYELLPYLSLLAGAGLVLGVDGAAPISVRFSLGSVLRLGIPGYALLLLSYERGGVDRDLNPILGCEDACLYQQMQLGIGWRPKAD
jgi:tetratricopeptide (TPR) repeat protein